MATAADRRCRRGHIPALVVVAVAVLASACSSEDAPRAPYTGCPPSGIAAPGPRSETVLAGAPYWRALGFPFYPCVQMVQDCIGIPGLAQICTTTPAQGSCSPGLVLERGPEAAVIQESGVRWETVRADAGLVADFEVVAQYPAGCEEQRRAWTVTVLPPPAPPVLRSVSLGRDVIRAGDLVTVVADFDGTAAWWNGPYWLGALESGVPSSAPLSFPGVQPITVRVGNAIGEVAEDTRTIRVWGLPAVRFTAASPQRFIDTADVHLSWEATEASSIVITPAPDSIGANDATRRITGTTTFQITAANPFGDVATDTVTVTKVEPAALHGFSTLTPAVAVGESPGFVATFSNGTGRLYAVRGGSPGATTTTVETLGVLESGVPFWGTPQRGTDLYRVEVTDGVTAGVSAEIVVTTMGPGSFRPLATGGLGTAPLVAAAPDGRVLALARGPLQTSPLFPALLEVDAGTVTTSAAAIPRAATVLAVVANGRAIASGWASYEAQASFLSFDPAHAASRDWLPTVSTASQFGPKVLVPLDGGVFFSVGESAAWRLDAETVNDARAVWWASPGPACRLADGRVLGAAGRAIFDPVADTLASPYPGAPVQRNKPSILCLSDGGALLYGGSYPTSHWWATELERFDPAAGSWTVLPVAAPRYFYAAVELTPGKVLLLTWSEGWVLDLATNTFARAGRFTYLRDSSGGSLSLSAIRLPDGRAVVHGSGGPVPELFAP